MNISVVSHWITHTHIHTHEDMYVYFILSFLHFLYQQTYIMRAMDHKGQGEWDVDEK